MLQDKPPAKTTVPNNPNKDISKSRGGQGAVGVKEAVPVSLFPLMVKLRTTAHALLGATG